MPLRKPVENLQHVQAPKVGIKRCQEFVFHTILVHVGPTINPKILGCINCQVLIACVRILIKFMWLRNMIQQLPVPEAL